MAHLSEAHQAPILEFVPELDRLAADAMADWRVPGVALAVVQDGKLAVAEAYGQRGAGGGPGGGRAAVAAPVVGAGTLALAKAYGQRDVAADLPVTTATQFLICSITKSFTA